MGSVNKAILVGNLGRDAEMRFTSGGTPVATVQPRDDREIQRPRRPEARKTRSGTHRHLGQDRRVAAASTSPRASRSTSRAACRRASGPTRKARTGTDDRDPRRPHRAARRWRRRRGAAGRARPRPRPRRRGAVGRRRRTTRRSTRRTTTTFRSRGPRPLARGPRERAAGSVPLRPEAWGLRPTSPPARTGLRAARRRAVPGVDASRMSESSIAVMRWTVFGVMCDRLARRHLAPDQAAVTFDLEAAAFPTRDRSSRPSALWYCRLSAWPLLTWMTLPT